MAMISWLKKAFKKDEPLDITFYKIQGESAKLQYDVAKQWMRNGGVNERLHGYYRQLTGECALYKIDGTGVFKWYENVGKWEYLGFHSDLRFWDETLFQKVHTTSGFKLEWDKYPTATHYNPVMNTYLKEIRSGVYNIITFRTLEESTGVHVMDEGETKQLIKRPKEETKMSKIGKVSGEDWSQAPKDAEHVYTGVNCETSRWRKNINRVTDTYSFWNGAYWQVGYYPSNSKYYISKEEDLGMQKTVNDITVGMFLKYVDGRVRLVSSISGYNKQTRRYDLVKMIHTEATTNAPDVGNPVSWSYSLYGKYTPFAPVETEEDKKLKELKVTIEQAQKQIDAIVKGK